MLDHSKPVCGFSQSASGWNFVLLLRVMGNPCRKKLVGVLRAVFADSLELAMSVKFPSLTNQTDRNQAVASASGVAKETIRRWLKHEVSPNLDQIELVAKALRVQPYRLLMLKLGAGESLALDPTHRKRPGDPKPDLPPSTNPRL